MKAIIISLAIASLFTIGNVNTSFGKNKIYRNVMENKAESSTTITLCEGQNDLNLVPMKQYTIKYASNGDPEEKVLYKWTNKGWQVTDKYEYVYDTSGKLEAIMHAEWDGKANLWKAEVEYGIYLLDIDKELLSVNETF